jgi:hypothetical protein
MDDYFILVVLQPSNICNGDSLNRYTEAISNDSSGEIKRLHTNEE